MKEEQEKELIIKNAFEFLKRKDLIIVDGVITYPFLSKHMLKANDVYGMCLEKYFNVDTYIFIQYKSRLDLTLRIDLDKNKELTDLFTETYNRLKTKQEQAEQPQDDYYLRKHDKGKAKLLQVPVEAIKGISEVMDYGSGKYGANSWQQVEIERYLQAGARHLYSVQEKDEQGRITFNLGKKDEESGIEHLKHALCNLAYVVALYEMKKEK